MPARTSSAIRAEVKKPKANTTSTKPGSCCIGGNTLGATKYQRKICTSNGILRKNSTHTFTKRTSQGLLGSVRSIPSRKPATMATTHELAATDTVQPHAFIIHCR